MSSSSKKNGIRIGASPLSSFTSFMIRAPILKSKRRAFRSQVILFGIEVILCISAILSDWLVIYLSEHDSTEHFSMTSSFVQPKSDGDTPENYVKVYIVPPTAQMCAYAAAGLSVIGFILSIIVTYSSKIPHFSIKFILGNNILIALAIFFLEIASQAGFESNMSQISTIVSLTGSLKGVNPSGRGYGYASLILSWIIAIPLVIVSNTVFFGHLKGAWEHDWRESFRASYGQGTPDWLQQSPPSPSPSQPPQPLQQQQSPPSPSNIQTELRLNTYQNKVPTNIKA